ncbi:MAG: MFS transporter [Opitutus sp.]|nr:MFS transporter [Opitutus sp.]
MSEKKPLWPVASLAILTGLNLLDYLDRTILGSVLPPLRDDLHLSYEQGGTIGTAFMLGYFLTSPIFGCLGDRMSRRWLIAAGVFVWSLGTLMSGHASAYVSLLFFRVLVGFGEASFGTLSPGWIADLFPPGRRNNAITVFYFAIPVGSAIGYLFGGWMAVQHGWRAAFLGAGYPGLLLAGLLFFLREPPRGASDDGIAAPASAAVSGWRVYGLLLKFPRYVVLVAGYTAQTFAMGGFQIWAPSFLVEVHHMKLDSAAFFFSASLAASGLVATLAGGFSATRWQRRTGAGYAWILALSALTAAPMAFLAFTVTSLTAAKVALAVTMFLLFLSVGPVNTLILETVPASMRASSMAASIFAIHMFGDLWSPKMVGHLADRWGDLQRAVLWTLPGALIVGAAFWTCLVVWTKRDLGRGGGLSVEGSPDR